MSDQDTQTVVDTTNPPAVPGGEAAGARTEDDLDTLLKAFDDQGQPSASAPAKPDTTTGPATETKSTPAASGDGGLAEVQRYIFRKDMDETITKVRGELDPALFDGPLVEAWLDAQARQDHRLAQAWANRHSNPKAFEKVVEGLGRSFAKKYGKMPDRGATEDRDAVAAAVRGASTRAPEGKAPDFGRMTDAEIQAWKDQNMG